MKQHYTVKEDGFCGDYFPGTKYRDKAILYFQGMAVDEKTAITWSKPFRDRGYNVMCVGYYLWEGLPKQQYDTPIEYAERAIAVLKKEGIRDFCIHGISGSSRYVLQAALLIPEISCVISIVPYDYITEGLKNNLFSTGHSIYTWRGEPIPFMQLDCLRDGVGKALGRFFRSKERLTHMTRWSYVVQENYDEAARIKIENLKTWLLLMAPDFDDTWPSDQAVARMEKVLQEHSYPYPYEVRVYEGASHAICVPMDEKQRKMISQIIAREKEDPESAKRGRERSIADMLAFTEKWMSREQ